MQALRSAQHFDALDIEQRRRHADAAEIDIVDEKPDRRIRRALIFLALADATNLEETGSRCAARVMQVRHRCQHILEVLPTRVTQDLRIEHRDLDQVIARLQMDIHVDEVQMRRLKKRKLMLKDQITRLESQSIPDLNA